MSARRGFTLLETVLSIAVGSLVLAAALSIMTTIRTSDRSLADQSIEMNDLAYTQLAVRRAMNTIHAASPGTVRSVLETTGVGDATSFLAMAFPEPIAGTSTRFEMTTGDNPRLELVLNQPLLAGPRDSITSTSSGALAVISADQLPGHRGAFELIREDGAESPSLFWVPLPPKDLPAGVVFDQDSLPLPHRLCRNVTKLTWTAFIDSGRVPRVRAIEAQQFPAYLELEIATAGGGYGNWMFEIGWTNGPEFDPPPELPSDEATEDPEAPNGSGSNDLDPDLIDPEDFLPGNEFPFETDSGSGGQG